MLDELKKAALDYHELPRPGKISVEVTKPAATQQDLILAYSPGVAAPVRAIAEDPDLAYRYTNKGNLVAVISNGTAILGLGDRGPLASKPVMEGKGVLFKRFADIDVFDIEMDCKDVGAFIDTVTRIAPTFGGINLEDIKSPECFEIEEKLIDRLDIPVFHDDQHGTAIISAAGLLNAFTLQGKDMTTAKIVILGAGAAAISTARMFISAGAHKKNIAMLDRSGVIHAGRTDLNDIKREWAIETDDRNLDDAMRNADAFIGLSGPNLVSKEHIASMNDKPTVFALANPDPEILPKDVKAVRPDAIIATGRSDYPNQVNNVLGFPFIFRGALDVRARRINDAMKLACVHALQAMAQEPVPEEVLKAYELEHLEFGPDYIVPKPFDPRLIKRIPPAVARAAIKTGVSRAEYPKHYPDRI